MAASSTTQISSRTPATNSVLEAARNSPASAEQVAQRVESAFDQTQKLLNTAIEDRIELSVVIPVYNEPVTILEIVERVRQLPIRKQIIIVNDGSSDGTAEQLRALDGVEGVEVLHHEVNRGKGAALQTGFERARGEIVIVQDADLEYDPRDILKVIAPLQAGESDVVYGSRYLECPEQDPSRLHRLGNWGLTFLSNKLTGFQLTDMETCYKAFRRQIIQGIHIEQSRFGFEPEITAKLSRQKIAIREVGIGYQCRSRDEGKKIGWRDLFNALYCIVRYSLLPCALRKP